MRTVFTKIETYEKSNPIPEELKEGLIAHFNHSYGDEINTAISNIKLDAKWTDISPFVDFPQLQNAGGENLGVGLFYVLDSSLDYFTYVISLAQRLYLGNSKWKIEPIPVKSDGYFMFTNPNQVGSLPYKIIPHSKLNELMGNYTQNVKVRVWPNGEILEVKNLENSHPKICFFSGNIFSDFVTQNISPLTSNDFDLTIYNGAIYKKNIGGHVIEVQTPVVVVEHNDIPMMGTKFETGTPFKNQGLDVGRLCPPDC